MRLAIIDLDGPIADPTARFAKAEEAKQAFIAQRTGEAMERYNRTHQPWQQETIEKQATDLYWRTTFDPALVPLDTLVPGAKEAVETLLGNDSTLLIYLTSRPEAMRDATITWLMDQGILDYTSGGEPSMVEVVMKPSAFQYTKTTVWKAGMIQHLAAWYGPEEILVVDDEQVNRDYLAKFAGTFPQFAHAFPPRLVQVATLAEAVAYTTTGVLPEPADDHPF